MLWSALNVLQQRLIDSNDMSQRLDSRRRKHIEGRPGCLHQIVVNVREYLQVHTVVR